MIAEVTLIVCSEVTLIVCSVVMCTLLVLSDRRRSRWHAEMLASNERLIAALRCAVANESIQVVEVEPRFDA